MTTNTHHTIEQNQFFIAKNVCQDALNEALPIKPLMDFIKNRLPAHHQSLGYAIAIHEIFTGNHLPPESKAKVIEQYQLINVDTIDWWDFLYSVWTEKLARLGFENSAIAFSGFWSQGDGASFTADINLEIYLKAHKLGNAYRAALLAAKANEVKLSIYRLHARDVHEYSISISLDYSGESEKARQQLEALAQDILTSVRGLSKEIYLDLRDEYEYLTSEQAILETLEANDYYFTQDGELFLNPVNR